jgi:hypothetical protein
MKCESVFGIDVAYTPGWKDCVSPEFEQRSGVCVGTKKPDKLRCTVRDRLQNKFYSKWHSNTAQSVGSWRSLSSSVIIRVSRLLANPVFTELRTAFRIAVTTLTRCFDYLLTEVSGLRFYGILGLLVLVDWFLRNAGTYIPYRSYWLRRFQLTLAVVCAGGNLSPPFYFNQ